MSNHAFLKQVGVYTIPEFMTAEECSQWRGVAVTSGGEEARVYGKKGQRQVDEHARKTLTITIDEAVRSGLEDRIRALRTDLERFFGVPLDSLDQLHCLMYRTGDFFRMHADTPGADDWDDSELGKRMRRRAVTVLVFLNNPGHDSESYEGGQLTLFGLLSGAASKTFGFPVDAEAGLLVAFRPAILHEVSPITAGKRYTLVTWFLEREPSETQDDHHAHIETQTPGNG